MNEMPLDGAIHLEFGTIEAHDCPSTIKVVVAHRDALTEMLLVGRLCGSFVKQERSLA